jgi:hypothetical protein
LRGNIDEAEKAKVLMGLEYADMAIRSDFFKKK